MSCRHCEPADPLQVATSLIVGLGLLFPLAMWGALAYFGG